MLTSKDVDYYSNSLWEQFNASDEARFEIQDSDGIHDVKELAERVSKCEVDVFHADGKVYFRPRRAYDEMRRETDGSR